MSPRALKFWVGFFTVVAALLRARGVMSQPATPDELNAIPAALGYLEGAVPGPLMVSHPHLRDLGIAALHAIFGPGVLAARGLSVLLGVGCVPLLAALVWRLSKNARATAIAALLLAIDPASIFFSRLAYQEVWTAFLSLLGAWLVAEAVMGGAAFRLWLFPLAGLAFGLGTASKFNAVPVLAVSGLLAVLAAARARRWPEVLWVTAALGVLPVAVYVATWWPWFGRGQSTAEWFAHQQALLGAMSVHQTYMPRDPMQFSRPSLWFLQPFIGWPEKQLSANGVGLTFAVGNPAVWLLTLPAVGYALHKNRRRTAERVLLLLFFAGWASMVLPNRPIWIVSALCIVPFAFGLIGLAAADLEARLGGPGMRRAVNAWLAVAVMGSLLLFPGLVGRGPDTPWLRPLVAYLTQSAQGP